MSETMKKNDKRKFVEPTADEKRSMYEMYKLIHGSHFSPAKKRSVMTAVLGYESWSWRVVGITEEAIKAIARNDFKKPSHVLARDHNPPRSNTYAKIFSGTEPMPFADWWAAFWENDKTILMTNDEHRREILISRVFELDPKDGYFIDAEVAGWHQTKAHEGALIERLCAENKIAL